MPFLRSSSWGIEVPAHARRHDGTVNHAQPLQTVDPAPRIDDRHRVFSHPAGAAGVVGALGRFPNHRVGLGIVAGGGPGRDGIATEGVKGALRHALARLVNAGRKSSRSRGSS